ncbi:hypothetical protein [Humisphaera borealis]|uniref:Glucuronate isomerase n=1 Tax=Humisphaera borealis TaxID=2807512 RepID=A0A7M2X3L0_9BACT|nr:hypothetical protein [Humisphaera borealis]QOV92264.1 glucuronate isomerase [Humisphaera borealis]
MSQPLHRDQIEAVVSAAVQKQPVVDMHTHLYSPAFGTPVPNAAGPVDPTGLLLWGLDELVTYHYLIAEVFRVVPATVLPYDTFFKMSKVEQADHIWKHLFVERSPISEACRGVLTTLHKLGLDVSDRKLDSARKWFKEQKPGDYIDKVMELANVESITMTNPVFDDGERERWLRGIKPDPRFQAVLRIDPLLLDWPAAAKKMASWGYGVSEEVGGRTIEEARRFLRDWIDKQNAIYLALSLPPSWRYPADPADAAARAGQAILEQVILPVCAERGLAFAMMIGSRRAANPALRDAGDMVGTSDVDSVTALAARFPGNRFFVTMLARENQHALAVAARKFGNLMVFGCWWFVNNPSLITEITKMRVELLGTSFIPQHSDARVLDQLLYKWDHSRKLIAGVLAEKYRDAVDAGWKLTTADIERDVALYLKGNFRNFL